jgi:hypothetical protein
MGILDVLMGHDQQQKQQQIAKFYSDVEAAGSRERALDVVKNYSGQFGSPSDFNTAFQAVDKFYPQGSKEVKQVTVYDAKKGTPTTAFIPSSDVPSLNDPKEVQRRFGPDATLTKPDLETFYSQPDAKGNVQVLGKMPVSQRPQGAVTLPELTAARQARGEEASQKRFQLSQDKFNAWFGLAEKRWASALEKLGGTASSKELSTGRSLLNDATKLTALSLNGKVLPDGTFSFDDDNRVKLFNKRLRYMQNMIEQNPGILKRATGGLELHTSASKALPLTSETPQPPAPPAKPKPEGLLTKAYKYVTGEGDVQKKPVENTKAASQGDPAAQIKARAEEINSRTDITAEQKKAALARLREIAGKNKIKVDF